MFRDDSEFRDDAMPSHLTSVQADQTPLTVPEPANQSACRWEVDAQTELKKVPFFVRGKARRNTELYARERGLETITVETLYDAKAHFGR